MLVIKKEKGPVNKLMTLRENMTIADVINKTYCDYEWRKIPNIEWRMYEREKVLD